MIKISKLRLKNFKSFKKAEIPFASGFTAIVGSNGSGKSNLLDALLFVLGITSMKALRASRLTDLVNYNAAEDYAMVEIELKADGKNYLLSRSIDKQGRSVARLEGKRVGLNEVTSLLEELGIDVGGHNIVSQGEITRIIEMDDIERRELIDDLAGLREFDEKKAEALSELQKVDQKIREVRIVLEERSAYLEQLAKDREAAVEFNKLVAEEKTAKATLLHSEIERIKKEFSSNSERILGLEKEKGEKAARLAEEKSQLLALEKEIEGLSQKILSHSEKAFAGIGIDLEEKKAERRVVEERLQSKKSLAEKSQRRIQELLERNNAIVASQDEKRRLSAEKEKELATQEEKLSELKARQKGLSAALGKQQSALKEIEDAKAEIEARVDSARQDFLDAEFREKAAKERISLNARLLKEALFEKEQLDKKIVELQKKHSTLSELRSRHKDISKEIAAARESLEEASRQKNYCEARQKSLKEAIGQLKKAEASCPICDSRLSATKKDSLAEKKSAELGKEKIRSASLEKQCQETAARFSALEEAARQESVLEIELKGFAELKAKERQLKEKSAELEKACSAKPLEAIAAEKASLEKLLSSEEARLEEKESEIAEFRKGIDVASLEKLGSEIDALSQKKSLLHGQKKELELEAERLLGEERKRNLSEIERQRKDSALFEEESKTERAALAELEAKTKELELEMLKAEKAGKALAEEKEKKSQRLFASRERLEKEESRLRDFDSEKNNLLVENGKLEVRLADLKEESEKFLGAQTLKDFDASELKRRLPAIEKRIKELGAINMKALEEFGSYEMELLEVKKKSEKLEEERLAVLDMINKIEVRRTEVFLECFNSINRNFGQMFFLLTEGEGKLRLSNEQLPLESGLLIEARVRDKEIRNMDLMSGGEKSITALAFLFAMQMYDPAPFYVFDEADAALDRDNSARLARVITDISKKSQFVAITHNDTVVKEAHQIIGVALNKDKSSVVGLRLKEEIEQELSKAEEEKIKKVNSVLE